MPVEVHITILIILLVKNQTAGRPPFSPGYPLRQSAFTLIGPQALRWVCRPRSYLSSAAHKDLPALPSSITSTCFISNLSLRTPQPESLSCPPMLRLLSSMPRRSLSLLPHHRPSPSCRSSSHRWPHSPPLRSVSLAVTHSPLL